MAQSSIEWTELTWNPTTGCTKLSAGCKFCYAEVMTKRLKGMGLKKYKDGFKLKIHPEELQRPYSWKKPSVVFVNSMSDLFHKEVPLSFIKDVFKVMNDTPQHTYQVLTKRPELVLKYNNYLEWSSNIWMGTSIENENVVKRIDYLRKTDAHIKFLSIEPLIAPLPKLNLINVDWVIVGGESGHGARPIQYEWVQEIRRQCKKRGVYFFFKQWGKPEFNPNSTDPTISPDHINHAKGGCQLKGNIYREIPERANLKVAV
jgi:protein gp37